ncbi:MAG: hypothetical protein GTO45_20840 [Candidatus Aminicenantes bacterium]|nr:hypothetical protein [Candidatus Aminicenantes bacterium]NIM81235.1 hypothetical protein [Candidatus Aminicenantes bacterium]NIN20610.1 hypothetical protein [Candidatus Aminicenantes bacterium]NIN44389.1 hypothetical protein [Candidatus Aminicenantes bacterium]NIN87208.1 hypothetical protein [Candidatus Aminicenantes bacterium]
MRIRINETELEIFSGARVNDALLKYSKDQYRAVVRGEKQVTDQWNHPLELEGELSQDQQLYVIHNPVIPNK